MAKIASELAHAISQRQLLGQPGEATARPIASGTGWSVSDVLCTSGPGDRPFEELHSRYSVAVVMAGTFQYRSASAPALMTPGSLLLGNAGECFQCGHQHGTGDRCLAFNFDRQFFEELAGDCCTGAQPPRFRNGRISPVAELSRCIARSMVKVSRSSPDSWEELAIGIAAMALQADQNENAPRPLAPAAFARVTRVLRLIDNEDSRQFTLEQLAAEARLSRYHFLRTFQQLTGLTPHQYLLRSRLRSAAIRLSGDSAKVLDIALDCGFRDISNFNRNFRREFKMSPRQWRASSR